MGCASSLASKLRPTGTGSSDSLPSSNMRPTATGKTWTSVTTLSIPTIIGDNECEEGQHQFSHYPACRTLLCSMCSQHVSSGSFVHSCNECDTDLCDACFACQKPKSRASKTAEAPKKKGLNQSPLKDADVKE